MLVRGSEVLSGEAPMQRAAASSEQPPLIEDATRFSIFQQNVSVRRRGSSAAAHSIMFAMHATPVASVVHGMRSLRQQRASTTREGYRESTSSCRRPRRPTVMPAQITLKRSPAVAATHRLP